MATRLFVIPMKLAVLNAFPTAIREVKGCVSVGCGRTLSLVSVMSPGGSLRPQSVESDLSVILKASEWDREHESRHTTENSSLFSPVSHAHHACFRFCTLPFRHILFAGYMYVTFAGRCMRARSVATEVCHGSS